MKMPLQDWYSRSGASKPRSPGAECRLALLKQCEPYTHLVAKFNEDAHEPGNIILSHEGDFNGKPKEARSKHRSQRRHLPRGWSSGRTPAKLLNCS